MLREWNEGPMTSAPLASLVGFGSVEIGPRSKPKKAINPRKAMQPVPQTPPVSKKALWAGYIMSVLPVLMLLFSAAMKFAKPPPAVEGFKHLGLPESFALGLGVLELGCTLLYIIPRTSVLGAILLTGYLG